MKLTEARKRIKELERDNENLRKQLELVMAWRELHKKFCPRLPTTPPLPRPLPPYETPNTAPVWRQLWRHDWAVPCGETGGGKRE